MAPHNPVNHVKSPAKAHNYHSRAAAGVSAWGQMPIQPGTKQLSAPPVYRSSRSSSAVQSKVVKPTAPPVYRPEVVVPRAMPPVMQAKVSKLAPPPVYRPAVTTPRAMPPVMQPKTGKVAAPPVYRPAVIVARAKPPVMQLKANKIAPPPVYSPQPSQPRLQGTAAQVPSQALRSGAPPVYVPQQPSSCQNPVQRVPVPGAGAPTSPLEAQHQGQSGPRPWWPQSGSLQLSKRKRSSSQSSVNYNDDDDPYGIDEDDFGENPDYPTQLRAYTKQQVRKKQKVKEDPDATRITYQQSTGSQQELVVRTMGWMETNWNNVKGNTEWGTYATSITVGDSPFYFRANNTMDVGLSPMTLGDTESSTTYVSAKARNFKDIGAELDHVIGEQKKKKRKALRKEIGRSILEAIKSRGKTTPVLKGLKKEDRYLVKELIAELAAIWIVDLYRSEGKQEKVLAHQEELLTGTDSFSDILQEGVYLGMKAKDLR